MRSEWAVSVAMCAALAVAVPGRVWAHLDVDVQIQETSKQIAAEPNNAMWYLQRGNLHRVHQDWASATADYDRAAELDPTLSAVDLERGVMMYLAGWHESAVVVLDRFISRHPGDVDGLITRARALAQLEQYEAAAADYTLAIEAIARPEPDYYLERARVTAARGADYLDEAIRGLDEGAERLGPTPALTSYAVELELSRRQYLAALDRLHDMRPDASGRQDAWLAQQGEIFELADRRSEALGAYTAALETLKRLPESRREAPAVRNLETKLRASVERLEKDLAQHVEGDR